MAMAHTQPHFLDLIETDPLACAASFYRYAMGFFETAAPRLLKSLEPHDAEEVRSRIVLHCIRDDCRVLNEYREVEGPFAGWFAILCLNKTKDYLKELGRYRETVVSAGDHEPHDYTSNPRADAHSPDLTVESGEKLRIVRECIGRLDHYCRLLVRMAAEEFKPREMVRVLRWPQNKAKKVSDDLRYCREKLRQLLTERHVE